MNPEQYMSRLTFIRYLYTEGLNKSKEFEPQSATSILLFHDSVELLLNLVSEHLGVASGKREFMDYWKQFDKTVPVMQGHKKTMEKLNRLRVDLKHHGIIPHKMETEACRVNVASFMDAVVSAVFAIEFENVSMVDLIQNQKAKSKLVEANRNMDDNEISKALLNIAIAFQELIHDYEDERAEQYSKAPFEFARDPYLRSSTNYLIEEEHKDLVEVIISLQDAIKIMGLGIDYQRYTRFKSMTPDVHNDGNGGWEPSFYFQAIIENHVDRNDYRLPSKTECQFCFDFVGRISSS